MLAASLQCQFARRKSRQQGETTMSPRTKSSRLAPRTIAITPADYLVLYVETGDAAYLRIAAILAECDAATFAEYARVSGDK
jgi:hypothetical protein